MFFNKSLFLKILTDLSLANGPSLNEDERAGIITEYLGEFHIPFYRDNAKNIIIQLNGKNPEPPVVFDAHMDVAGKGYCEKIRISKNRITGQGCADDLAAVVFLILAASQLKDMQLNKPLHILFSSGEEGKGNLAGIKEFVSNAEFIPEIFVAFDLSFNTISFTGLGSKRMEIQVSAPGGHSFEDYGKPNAIEILCQMICDLKKEILSKGNNLTFNTGKISGGSAVNLIPDKASALIEFRSVSPELLEDAEKLTTDLMDSIRTKEVKTEKKDSGSRPGAFNKDQDILSQRILPIFNSLGIEPEIKPMSTNINATISCGWPSFCTGLCQCGNFHTEEEFIELNSLEKGWNLLVGLIKEFGIV